MLHLPLVGQQLHQLVVCRPGVIGHPGDDVVEVVPRVDVVVAAGGQQRADDRHVAGRLVVAAEEVVLPAERDGADLVLGKVVVEQQPAVLEDAHHVVPAGVGVGDGLADKRAFAVLGALGLHPQPHGLHDGLGQFLAHGLAFVGRHPGVVARMLCPVEVLYLREGVLGHRAVLVERLLEVAAYVDEAVHQAHVGVVAESRLIAPEAVALQVSLEVVLVRQRLYHRPRPGALVVVEEHQPLHHRPYHPDVLLRRLVAVAVDDRDCRLVGLGVARLHDLGLKRAAERPEQLHGLLELAVHGALAQPLHAEVAVLLDLAVVGHVVLVLLEQDVGQQAGAGDALVDGQQRHGGHQHALLPLGSLCGVVLQAPLLADDLLDVELAGLVLHHAGHLLADLLVEGLVDTLGGDDHALQHGKALHHLAVLPFACAVLLDLGDLPHGFVPRFPGLLHPQGLFVGEEAGLVGVDDAQPLRLAPEELAVEPCHLGGQLLDAPVEGVDLPLVVLRHGGDGGVERLYRPDKCLFFLHPPCRLNMAQRYGKFLEWQCLAA